MKKTLSIFALILVGLVVWTVMNSKAEKQEVKAEPVVEQVVEEKAELPQEGDLEVINACIYRDLDREFTPLIEDGTLDMEIEMPEGYVEPTDAECNAARGK